MKLGRALHLQSRRLGTASLKNYKARNQLLHKGSHVCHSWRVEESKVGSAPFKFHLGTYNLSTYAHENQNCDAIQTARFLKKTYRISITNSMRCITI